MIHQEICPRAAGIPASPGRERNQQEARSGEILRVRRTRKVAIRCAAGLLRDGLATAIAAAGDMSVLPPENAAPAEAGMGRPAAPAADVALWVAESGAGLEALGSPDLPRDAVLFDVAGRLGPVVAGLHGFRGYLPPDVAAPRLLDCLRRVAAGQPDAPRPYLVPLVRALAAPPLTDLDCQILRLLALGRSQQEIEQALPLGRRTLQRHITRLLDRWEATDGHHLGAVAVAIGLGWPWERVPSTLG